MLTRILYFLLLTLPGPTRAQSPELYVGPSGSDSSDCTIAALPCRSLTRACDLISGRLGWKGQIRVADGVYSGGCNLTYSNVVTIIGNCDRPDQVEIIVSSREIAFFAQDHAIAGINCLTIASVGSGSMGIATRQYAIADYNNVRFGNMLDGKHVSATEASKINCLKAEIVGGAAYHLAASLQSQIIASCETAIPRAVAFSSFTWVVWRSLLNASGGKFFGEGVGGTTGLQFIVDDSTIIQPETGFPGVGDIIQHSSTVK
jgi:hypothetical protein